MPNYENGPCPICSLENRNVQSWDGGERSSLECRRCGKFTVTSTAAAMIKSRELSPLFSAWIRDRSETGGDPPKIDSKSLNEIATNFPRYRVTEKLLILLRALERGSEHPGSKVEIHFDLDYPIAWAESGGELRYLLGSLFERKLVFWRGTQKHKMQDMSGDVEITATPTPRKRLPHPPGTTGQGGRRNHGSSRRRASRTNRTGSQAEL